MNKAFVFFYIIFYRCFSNVVFAQHISPTDKELHKRRFAKQLAHKLCKGRTDANRFNADSQFTIF